MNLNQIQLPASVIANLYKHSLVDTGDYSTTESVSYSLKKSDTSEDRWKYLGENKKNILIIVNYPDVVYLPDDELAFLTNMLAACKLNLGDVAIVNRNNSDDMNYRELIAQFSSKIVFLFGVEPISFGLPLSFPHFQVQSFDK